MKKSKFLSVLLAMLLMVIVFSSTAFARYTVNADSRKAEVILSTNNSEIGIVFFVDAEVDTLSYNTKTRTGTGYFYKTATGSKIADFDCTGTFSYDGNICNVTDVSTSVWNAIDGYKIEVSKSKNQISPTYARATGVFDLHNLGGGGDILTSSATINIYCTQDGTTSVEFNSD